MQNRHSSRDLLIYAAQINDVEAVVSMLDGGSIDINYQSIGKTGYVYGDGSYAYSNSFINNGDTALIKASASGSRDCVKVLLEKGADIELKVDKGGLTALDLAVRCRDLSVVYMLLERGANINIPSEMLDFLDSLRPNCAMFKYCYDCLVSCLPFQSSVDTEEAITIEEIMLAIKEKIKDSENKDSGFSGLFRDTGFSACQIGIAEKLLKKIEEHSRSLKNLSQLKAMILLDFEIASKAFSSLSRRNRRNGDIHRIGLTLIDKKQDVFVTKFHAAILMLAEDIKYSNLVKSVKNVSQPDRGFVGTLFSVSPQMAQRPPEDKNAIELMPRAWSPEPENNTINSIR